MHPLVEQNTSSVVERTNVISRGSFLLSDEPIVLDVDLEPSFAFNGSKLASGPDFRFTEISNPKHVFQPYIDFYYDQEPQPVIIEVEEALKRVGGIVDALNDLPTSIEALVPSTRRKPEDGIWSSVESDASDSVWSGLLPLFETDQEPPFDFESAGSVPVLRSYHRFDKIDRLQWVPTTEGSQSYTLLSDHPFWTTSGQHSENSEKEPDRGATDIPGAPRQQIEDLMRATPGFYEAIPELQRFLDR